MVELVTQPDHGTAIGTVQEVCGKTCANETVRDRLELLDLRACEVHV